MILAHHIEIGGRVAGEVTMLKLFTAVALVCLTLSGCAVYEPAPYPGTVYAAPYVYAPPVVYYGGGYYGGHYGGGRGWR